MSRQRTLLRALRQLLAIDRPQRSQHLYDKIDFEALRHSSWTR